MALVAVGHLRIRSLGKRTVALPTVGRHSHGGLPIGDRTNFGTFACAGAFYTLCFSVESRHRATQIPQEA
jgi:hypothetical protein